MPVSGITEQLSEEQATYVSLQRVAHLATADREGRPYVVPVCFVLSEGRIYIALDSKPKSVSITGLKRVRNIQENPNVSFLVDTYAEDWSSIGYVMLNGTARMEAPGTEQHTAAILMLRGKYHQYLTMPIESNPLIMIEVASAYAWGETANQSVDGRGIDFLPLARGRHVVRQYKQVPVPRAVVEATIEAAGWAPSPHGAQPWRFVVLTDQAAKNRLADAMSQEWQRNLEMDGQDKAVVLSRLEKSRRRITNSPVIVIPCLYLEELHTYPDLDRQAAEVTMAVQSIGAAIQNMLLSAYSKGLDTGWMCAPLFCPGVVREALGLPDHLTPHALINMGYGAKDPPRRAHRPISDLIVRYD